MVGVLLANSHRQHSSNTSSCCYTPCRACAMRCLLGRPCRVQEPAGAVSGSPRQFPPRAGCGISCLVTTPGCQSPSAPWAPSYPLAASAPDWGTCCLHPLSWAPWFLPQTPFCAWWLTVCHREPVPLASSRAPAGGCGEGEGAVGISLALSFKVTSARLCP